MVENKKTMCLNKNVSTRKLYHKRWNMDFGYREGERYKIVNPEWNNHNKMFTVTKVEEDSIYYIFDGESIIHVFHIGSVFESYIEEL